MTFSVDVRNIRVKENYEWEADVELGDDYWIKVSCDSDGLSCTEEMKHLPCSYDTVLEQVDEILDTVETPDVETGEFGDLK